MAKQSKVKKAKAPATKVGQKIGQKISLKPVKKVLKSTTKASAKAASATGPARPAKSQKTQKSQKTLKSKIAKKINDVISNIVYKIGVGDKAPAFDLPATSERQLSNQSFANRNLVLYFYPKDNTPGCTVEGQDFRKLYRHFDELDCDIVGVSRDSMAAHEKFKEGCDFPFELLSDAEGDLCRKFDVIQMKSLYGRKYEGIERSTFVIDKKGVIRGVWRKVKVPGHAEEVLDMVRSLD